MRPASLQLLFQEGCLQPSTFLGVRLCLGQLELLSLLPGSLCLSLNLLHPLQTSASMSSGAVSRRTLHQLMQMPSPSSDLSTAVLETTSLLLQGCAPMDNQEPCNLWVGSPQRHSVHGLFLSGMDTTPGSSPAGRLPVAPCAPLQTAHSAPTCAAAPPAPCLLTSWLHTTQGQVRQKSADRTAWQWQANHGRAGMYDATQQSIRRPHIINFSKMKSLRPPISRKRNLGSKEMKFTFCSCHMTPVQKE